MKRTQITLFVDSACASSVEQVRQRYNSIQHALIPCHVTLCREDEIEPYIDQITFNLMRLKSRSCEISFGRPTRFDNGKGVLLPAIGTNTSYHALRKNILNDCIVVPSKPDPHITLMHPRNSTCTDRIFEEIQQFVFPSIIRFSEVCLIEQSNGGKWNIVQKFYSPDLQ